MDTLAKKRISIYLMLIIFAFSVSMQHPGFAMMVTGTMIFIMLMLLRVVCHFEGQYMLKASEAEHGSQTMAHGAVYRKIGMEFGVIVGVGFCAVGALWLLVRHVPWLWIPTS